MPAVNRPIALAPMRVRFRALLTEDGTQRVDLARACASPVGCSRKSDAGRAKTLHAELLKEPLVSRSS